MFKPNAGAARAISRSLIRPRALNAARRLHAQAEETMGRSTLMGLGLAAVAGVGALASYHSLVKPEVQAEVIVPRAVINMEDTAKSKISAQHIQVRNGFNFTACCILLTATDCQLPRKSRRLRLGRQQVDSICCIGLVFTNANVYCSGKVVAPSSSEKVIKTARRLPFFDGVLLRDLQLGRDVGGMEASQILYYC